MEDISMETTPVVGPSHSENNQRTDASSMTLPVNVLSKEIALIQLHQGVRFCFESFKVCDVVMVNTKIVVVDSRVPIHIVIRSLFEYNKSIAIVYDESIHKVAGCLDITELMDYSLYLYNYFNETAATSSKQDEGMCTSVELSTIDSTSLPPTFIPLQPSPSSTLPKEGIAASYPPSQTAEIGLEDIPPSQENPSLSFSAPSLTRQEISLLEVSTPHEDISLKNSSNYTLTAADASSTLTPKHANASPLLQDPSFPPWDYTVEQWRGVYTIKRQCEYVCGKQTTLEALNLLLDKSVPYLIVWNEERSAPLSFLSPINLLALLVQNLRGNFNQFDLNLKEHLKVGTYEDVVTVQGSTSISETIHLLRKKQISTIPITESDGTYIGCFSENHFLQLLFKSFTENFSIQPDLPILQLLEMVNRPFSIPSDSVFPASPISPPVPLHNYPPRRVGTEPAAAVSAQHGGHTPQKTTASTYLQQTMPSPAIAVKDITLREAILQVLQCDEHRIIFADENQRVTGVVTATDLCRYLVGHGIQMATHHVETVQKEIEVQFMRQNSFITEIDHSNSHTAHPLTK
ncbi:CBS domain-containing protein [Cardiosporidium cionae]|uniref:CBS domain-containing protein n=1 Tax=Cardiosporidium cionae TaxID=476202 RepID=A0ABQ7J8Y2_9APIC|nr:CBS domain-containing protein [Cardiosporidium cionae]|eukprot:KAF8820442.1 CBS domain-containing protein [Cardiosporidium cionae]